MDGKKGIVPAPFIFDPRAPARLVGTLKTSTGADNKHEGPAVARLKRGREEEEAAAVEAGHGRLKNAKALPPGSGVHGAAARRLIGDHRPALWVSAELPQRLFEEMLDKPLPPSQLRAFATCVMPMLGTLSEWQVKFLRQGLCAAVMARSKAQADTRLQELLGALFEVLGTDAVKPVLALFTSPELDRASQVARTSRAPRDGKSQSFPPTAVPDIAGLRRRVQWVAGALMQLPDASPRERLAPLLKALGEMAGQHPALSARAPRSLETTAGLLVASCDAPDTSSTQAQEEAREAWRAVLETVTDPAKHFTAAQRACMVFHLAQAGTGRLDIADAPALLLAAIADRRDLPVEDAGAMVEALCLHLGPPAFTHAWDQAWAPAVHLGQLDVRASVRALLGLAARFSPPALARLGAALWNATAGPTQESAVPLGQAMAGACQQLTAAKRRALALGCELTAVAREPLHRWKSEMSTGEEMARVLEQAANAARTPLSVLDWTGLSAQHKADLLDIVYFQLGQLSRQRTGEELLQILCLEDAGLREEALMTLCKHNAEMLSGSSIAVVRESLVSQMAVEQDLVEGPAQAVAGTAATLLAFYEYVDKRGVLPASLIEQEIDAIGEDAPPSARDFLLAQLQQMRAFHLDPLTWS